MMSSLITDSIIGGETIKGSESLPSYNPATGEVIAEITLIGKDKISYAVDTARDALEDWKALSFKERGKHLSKISDWLVENGDEVAELVTMEQGKPISESACTEIIPVMDNLKYFARNTERDLRERSVNYQQVLLAHKKGRIIFEPKGVVASITPWNFPFNIPFIDIISAIICGNTVILKPSPETFLTGLKIGDICREAGLPPGVVNVIAVSNENSVELTRHPGVNQISFTGSIATGRKVMAAAAENLTPVVLELGGNDPAIVTADADIERSARGIVWGAFTNAGQVCVSVERVYVDRSIAERFTEALVSESKKLRLGDPTDPETDIGPMTTAAQVKIVEEHVSEAVEMGAKALCGGKRLDNDSNYYPPTVLTGVNHNMRLMREETFGPVLPVMETDSIDEAIKLANDTHYGLGASGWTTNRTTARKIQDGIEAGQVTINDCISAFGEPCAPWGGVKQSGIGRSHTRYGLLELVHVKYADYDGAPKEGQVWWYPYNKEMREFFRKSYPALYSKNLISKTTSLISLLMLRRFWKRISLPKLLRRAWKLF